MRSKKNVHKNKAFVVWLVVCVFVLAVGLTYTAYTNYDRIRRVITTEGVKTEFSSNYLLEVRKDSTTISPISVSFTYNSYITVTVANYPQSDLSQFNSSNITYDLVVKLLDKKNNVITASSVLAKPSVGDSQSVGDTVSGADVLGDSLYTVNGQAFADGVCTVSAEELKGGKASQNAYIIYVDPQYIDYVNISVEALPSAGSYSATNDKKLSAILASSVITTENAEWSGSYDDEIVSTNCKEIDSFNYKIAGKGVGKIKLSWNPEYVELSPYSIKTIKGESEAGLISGENSIEFAVGGVNQAQAYIVQFYRTKPADENEAYDSSYGVVYDISNPDNSKYVTFEFIADNN